MILNNLERNFSCFILIAQTETSPTICDTYHFSTKNSKNIVKIFHFTHFSIFFIFFYFLWTLMQAYRPKLDKFVCSMSKPIHYCHNVAATWCLKNIWESDRTKWQLCSFLCSFSFFLLLSFMNFVLCTHSRSNTLCRCC